MLRFFKAMRDEINVIRKENDALKEKIRFLEAKVEHLETLGAESVNDPNNPKETVTVQRILDEWLNGKEGKDE